jgi:excinuclease ABC subunit C
MKSLASTIKQLPDSPGIYQFYDGNGKLIYVGKSISLKKRVASYFTTKNLGPKTNMLVKQIKAVKTIKVFSEFEALLLESELIRSSKPFFNIIAKDDKSPIYIKITDDEVPLLTLSRKELPKRGIFIKGPFPSTRVTKEILKMTRKIFPYCQHKKPKKPCLFVHLGLCPYPQQNESAKEQYKGSIIKIKKLLSGHSKKLIKELTAEMQQASKKQQYEQALIVKLQIQNLKYLTTVFRTPREYLERPTLVDDLAIVRLKDLKDKLLLKHIPQRIECYDISNIQGKFATGSMVVFKNGQPEKSQYRKFKIKFSQKPNDYLMLKEVLARRFSNTWPTPDLIVIDGGKGQLNAAVSIVVKRNADIRVVSLAKRLEEIYTPEKVLPISLPKESPARQLAQAIRDEAHRFAITYHKHLRSKQFLGS